MRHALIVLSLCACAAEANQLAKAVDSATTVQPAPDSAASAPAKPVAAPPSYSDTMIPRRFVIADSIPWVDVKREIDTTESAPAFQCAPAMFTDADTLTLRIAAPHGNWVSVKRPDETTFYLVHPSAESAPNYSIVPVDSFPGKVMLRFLGGLVTKPGMDPSAGMTAVFDKPGHYEFRVGDDLATNRPRDVRECTIRFVPHSRY